MTAVIAALAVVGLTIGLTRESGSPRPQHHPSSVSLSPALPGGATVVLDRPEALAVAHDGSLLIADQGSNQILSRHIEGNLTVVAGTGVAGYSGDGGPAVHAELDSPGGMAVTSNGTIYVADTLNNRVRAISPEGTIATVAGTGQDSQQGTGGPAIDADVGHPHAVAVGPDGRVYIADDAGVQVLSATGTLQTVVPAGSTRLDIGGSLTTGILPDAVAVDADGNLWVADFSPKLLIEFSPTGHVLSSWTAYVTPGGLTAATDGSVLVADYGRFSADRVTGTQITPIATFTRGSIPGLTGTFRPSGIAASAAGQVYLDTDGANGGTSRPALATTSNGQTRLLATPTRVK